MAPKFGTSGLRGLVDDLTADLVAAHVGAFLRACPSGSGVFVGRDLRASSPRIAEFVQQAALRMGVPVVDCGAVPTPALALASMAAGAAAIMVTGSHIPDDRNGLKFYTPAGEITKADEGAIMAALSRASGDGPRETRAAAVTRGNPAPAYLDRYRHAFGPEALTGLRIGVWSHSAVGRDLLLALLRDLGAEVIEIDRSERFIPVDTEAVSETMRRHLGRVAVAQGLDAILSTDGDGDRPLMTDATGQVIPGDILGQITAAMLGARVVVTPVSSNTGVEAGGGFAQVIRCRIGSPYVIAAMEDVCAGALRDKTAPARVAGYEANGGFLLGFEAQGPAGPLPALMTRDSLLPMLAPLWLAARGPQKGLAALVAAQPARFTATDRLEDVPTARSAAMVAALRGDAARRAGFLAGLGEAEAARDETDGLRLILQSGRIVHLRPSGNAPEMRCYAEAESPQAAFGLLEAGLSQLRALLG
ncbi:MAG: phosphomannomutase [Gemmobacter sp.]|uniref:phosphomannomutase n=1 Tax=Gemmobacter sp. TaxID=1898957 RepID=UPI001A38FB04|nr:phosphomannomutase [Gemmobacter sp.]MBL8562990.1 phosphomannomutase [Gemmobacter sp.]